VVGVDLADHPDHSDMAAFWLPAYLLASHLVAGGLWKATDRIWNLTARRWLHGLLILAAPMVWAFWLILVPVGVTMMPST
jgi:hypothetical protein